MTSAQLAQQNNRDTVGRYAPKIGCDQGPDALQVGAGDAARCRNCGGHLAEPAVRGECERCAARRGADGNRLVRESIADRVFAADVEPGDMRSDGSVVTAVKTLPDGDIGIESAAADGATSYSIQSRQHPLVILRADGAAGIANRVFARTGGFVERKHHDLLENDAGLIIDQGVETPIRIRIKDNPGHAGGRFQVTSMVCEPLGGWRYVPGSLGWFDGEQAAAGHALGLANDLMH